MKKILFLAATALAMSGVAVPASAAVINLSAVGTATTNTQNAPVDQVAAAVNVNIGYQLDSAVDNVATVVNNVATSTSETTQGSLGLNGSLIGTSQLNLSLAAVDQNVYAINAGGALHNTDVTNGALAGNNIGSATAITVQY
jgi:hypothetical protein